MDLSQCRLLVTPTSYAKDDPRLKTDLEQMVATVIYNTTGRPLSSREVARLLPGVSGYIAGLDEIDRAALKSADDLKVIARYGAGIDNVDVDAARKKGIIVTNTPGANAVSVAELALALMLALARQIPVAAAATREGSWPRLAGTSLEGKTVGIIGLGAIGKELARRLEGFDCCVIAHDTAADMEYARLHRVDPQPLSEVLHRADFVTLHLPLTSETRRLVDADFLAAMKTGAYLVNTARGEIVDEAALFEALRSGHLRGAALDAFSSEPPDPEHPLLTLPQVIATPHIGAQTDGATNNMGRMALRDCLAVLQGDEPLHRVA